MAARQGPSFLERNPLFRKFIVASTLSLLGTSVFDVVFPLYVWNRTHSAFDLAMANFALLLPYLVAAPITGYSVDHLDRRKLLLFSDGASVVLLVFFLLYDLTGASSLGPIFATVFFLKTCAILFETVTTFQLIPALVRPADLPSANSWFLSSLRIVQVVGPAMGGGLMAMFGIRACVVANVASFAVTLYFVSKSTELGRVLRESEPTGRPRLSVGAVATDFVENLTFVLRSPLFRAFVPLMFLWNLSPLIPSTPTLAYYFTVKRGMSPFEYGMVVSGIGVCGIIGYAFASYLYDRRGFAAVFVGSALFQAAVGTLALFFYAFPTVFASLFAVSRAGSSVLNMGTFLLRQTRIAKSRAGSVNTALRMLFMSAAPTSALMQGFLLEKVGVGFALVLGAACLWGTFHYAKLVTERDKPHREQEKPAEAA